MKISIIILTCSQLQLTLRCLRSIAPITQHGDVEIILVDNGSTDSTVETVAQEFPMVRIISHPTNIGVSAGRNSGLKAATGEHLMILDNDTIATPEVILQLSRRLSTTPGAGLVAPRLVSPAGQTQSSFRPYPGILSKLRNVVVGKRRSSIVEAIPTTPHEPFYVIGAAQMFARTTYLQSGGLDEAIFYGPEDADFCMAVRKQGLKVIYFPDLTIVHDWQRATTSRLLSRSALTHMRALLHFYRKHRRWI
ncbi:MAG: glycosyltransferase family 2 protein [Muribaculaceae bacterium]|nr:glycosyltransferase family 2 protein [Muribaculaceae bacterium]